MSVRIAGFREEVHGRFALVIHPDVLISELTPSDYAAIALPGGFRSHGYSEIYNTRVYNLIQDIHSQGGTIATLCVGILPVAEAGLLKGKRATCYPHSRHDNLAQLDQCGATVVDEPIVVDDRIISCSGPAQSVDVALLLLHHIVGSDAVSEVRCHMMAGTANESASN